MVSKRIDVLDSLRGLAAISVVIGHCLVTFQPFYDVVMNVNSNNILMNILTYTPLRIIWAGHEAVILFFILSGYVLSIPYFNNSESDYLTFAIKRICRIYIPYILTIAFSMILYSVFSNHKVSGLSSWFYGMWNTGISFKNITKFIFMIAQNSHSFNTVTWSLVHELRISMIFPLIIIIFKKTKYKPFIIISISSCLIIKLLSIKMGVHINNSFLKIVYTDFSDTFYYIQFFIIGILLNKFSENIKCIVTKLKTSNKLILLFIAIFIYTNKGTLHFIYELLNNNDIETIISDYVTSIGCVLILVLSLNTNKLATLLKHNAFTWIGKISYSLYLVHVIVLLTLIYALSNVIPVYLLVIVTPILSIIVANVYYRIIELTSIKIGKTLSAKIKMQLTKKGNQKSYT